MGTLAEAWVNIGANSAPLTAGLAQAEGKVAKSTMQMQARLKSLGMAMTVVGAIGMAAFALTVKSAMKFEKELAQVSTMLDKSSMSIMPKYKQALLGMSAAFGESTDTLAKGLYDILSASIDSSKALDVLEEAAKAAVAGITDTGVAADAITTIINSYGLEAEDAAKVSDQLFAIVKRGKTNFAELAPAIGKVAATAAKSGLSFEELGASIATITRAGIRTDEAMTAVNGMLRAFLKPTDEAKKAAAEFGITMDTTSLKGDGLIGVLKKLKNATAEQVAQIFPNIRGLKGMISAMGDLTGYTKDYNLMLNSAGLTQEAFEKQTATTAFKLEQLKKTFGVISVQIGDVLIPIVSDLIVKIGKVVTKISEWIRENPKVVDTVVKLGAALSVFTMSGGILILMSLYVGQLKTALVGMSKTITMIIPKLATLRTSLNTVGGAALIAAANIIIWSEAWKAYQDVISTAKVTQEDVNKAFDITAKMQEKVAEKLGITVETLKEFLKTGEKATKVADWDAYNAGLTKLNELAEKGEISASGLYKAMRELAIETGVAAGKTGELESGIGTIIASVEDLKLEMELLTKENEAYGKSVYHSVQYYSQMADKLNEIDVILQAELKLLEWGTDAYKEKQKEIYENIKALNGTKEALDKLIEPLEGLDLVAAKMALLGDSIEEIPEKLGLLKTEAGLLKQAMDELKPETDAWYEAAKAYKANQDAIETLTESFNEYGEKGKELLERLVELTDKQEKLQEAIDAVEVDKASEAYQKLKIQYNENEDAIVALIIEINNLETEEKEAKQAAKDLAAAEKEVADELYELTHTPMENAIKKLKEQKQAYIDLGMSISKANEWYDEQAKKLKEDLNPALDDTAAAIKKIKEEGEKTFSIVLPGAIKQATQALNTFTKEALAATIANIKMRYAPAIFEIAEAIRTTTADWATTMFETRMKNVLAQMRQEISIIKMGYEEYFQILASLTPSQSPGAFRGGFPSFQHGTPYVPETGMALVHKGERIIPANQNTYNNSFSPTVNLSVQGEGSPNLIAGEVESVLYDMGRQFKRRGFEMIPGRG